MSKDFPGIPPAIALMADQIEWICDDIVPDCKFPGDVMVSILTNLPVKSLLKFKAVSKPWCCLISSPRFLKLHLHRQSLVAPANNCLIMLKADLEVQGWKCGIVNLSHNNWNAEDDVLMLELPSFGYTIIDSCNGLVCLANLLIPSHLMLWNPATRRYRTLDLPVGVKLHFHTLGLCYVDATNDFKILVWNDTRPPSPVDTPYLYVYSLSSHSWDRFDFNAPKTNIRFGSPTFMGRCMHWLAHMCLNGIDCTCGSGSGIVAFDVMDGAISWFHLPANCARHHLTRQQTLVIRGCLSIVILRGSIAGDVDPMQQGIEFWVMEEYGVEGSWVKRFFIQEEFTKVCKLCLRSRNDSEIVFNCNYRYTSELIFYDPYSKKLSYAEFGPFDVIKSFDYVESLASVGTS